MYDLFHLFWAQITVATLLLSGALFLALLYKGKHLFNNRYGNWIVAFFILMFFAKGNADAEDFKNSQALSDKSERKRDVAMVDFKIEENLLFDLHMNLHFIETVEGDIKAYYSNSSLTGFSAGYNWQMRTVVVNMESDNRFSYDISGSMHYYIFGMEVYSESKYFTGTKEFEHQNITIHRNDE